MMHFVVKSLLVVISLVVVNAARQKCNMTDIYADECGKQLLIFGNRDFKIPKDDTELVKHCERIDDGLKCFRRYSSTCLDSFSSQVISIMVKNGNSMSSKVCRDANGRSELLQHLRCFDSDDHLLAIHLCMDKYIVQMEHLANVTGDHRIPATCCSFHMLRECTEEKVSNVCQNKRTAEYIGNLVSGMTQELINFACGSYKSLSDCNRLMDKKEWQMFRELVASDDPEIIRSKKIFSSPFIVLKNVLKQLREE